jgi:hypothetical protein
MTAPLKPSTLSELLRISPHQLHRVDIALMNLLCSVGLPDANEIEIDDYLQILDEWADEAREMTESSTHLLSEHADILENSQPLYRMCCLSRTLLRSSGIRYCPDEFDRTQDADWSKSSHHMLHGLIGRERHGTCASLPVLLVAVARRLGYPMNLVHSPGHVFTRWDGLDHPNPDWRERRNIEFSGDFDSYPDERYYEQPVKWTQDTFEMERMRQPLPLFLRSLTPAEELASFLVQRGHALGAHEMFTEAMAAYTAAFKLAPHNDMYIYFGRECNRKQLDHALAPWQLTGQQYCAIIEKRLTGQEVPFPWETSRVASIERASPFSDPTIAPILLAAQQAVVARLNGFAKLPRAVQRMLQSKSAEPPRATTDSATTAALDQVFSDDMSDLF